MTAQVVEIQDEPVQGAYVIYVDGSPAGRAEYLLRDGQKVFVHTEVDESHSGLGLASRLVRFALDDVRASGELLVPICPFVRTYIRRHPEYEDLVDHEMTMRLKSRRDGSSER